MKKKEHKAETKAARAAVLALWSMPTRSAVDRPDTAAIKIDRGVKPVEEEVLVKKAIRYVDF